MCKRLKLRRTACCAAGLANITATYLNLLGYEAPNCWVPSLLGEKK